MTGRYQPPNHQGRRHVVAGRLKQRACLSRQHSSTRSFPPLSLPNHHLTMNSNKTRRVACDRCRDQKLRCPRVNSTSEQCARCLRARAKCVTSSTRPTGRPRKSPLPVTDQPPDGPGVKANTPLCNPNASLDAYPELIGPSLCPSAPEPLNLRQDEISENQASLPIQTVPGITNLFDFGLLGEESNGGFSALDI